MSNPKIIKYKQEEQEMACKIRELMENPYLDQSKEVLNLINNLWISIGKPKRNPKFFYRRKNKRRYDWKDFWKIDENLDAYLIRCAALRDPLVAANAQANMLNANANRANAVVNFLRYTQKSN